MTEKATVVQEGSGVVAWVTAASRKASTLTLFDGDVAILRMQLSEPGTVAYDPGTHGLPLIFRRRLRVNLRVGFTKYGRLLPLDSVRVVTETGG